jgi:hypothetical protein
MAWQEVLYGSLEHCWALFWVTQASGRFFFFLLLQQQPAERESHGRSRARRARAVRVRPGTQLRG